MKGIASLAFALALSALTLPAKALPPTGALMANAIAENAALDQGKSVVSAEMARRYFEADLIVTSGAFALAGLGLFAAVAGRRRRAAAAPRRDWEPAVMQALESDLALFVREFRLAA